MPLPSLVESRSIVKSDGRSYLVELKRVAEGLAKNPNSMKWIKEELYKLAAILRGADPTEMHVLKSIGFAEYSSDTRQSIFGLVYSMPTGHIA